MDYKADMTKQEMAFFRRRRERIKRMLARGISQAEIARRLGMKNRQRVNQIVNNK